MLFGIGNQESGEISIPDKPIPDKPINKSSKKFIWFHFPKRYIECVTLFYWNKKYDLSNPQQKIHTSRFEKEYSDPYRRLGLLTSRWLWDKVRTCRFRRTVVNLSTCRVARKSESSDRRQNIISKRYETYRWRHPKGQEYHKIIITTYYFIFWTKLWTKKIWCLLLECLAYF